MTIPKSPRKPTGRTRGRKMVTCWGFYCETYGFMDLRIFRSRERAVIGAKEYDMSWRIGPITRIALPLPVKKGGRL